MGRPVLPAGPLAEMRGEEACFLDMGTLKNLRIRLPLLALVLLGATGEIRGQAPDPDRPLGYLGGGVSRPVAPAARDDQALGYLGSQGLPGVRTSYRTRTVLPAAAASSAGTRIPASTTLPVGRTVPTAIPTAMSYPPPAVVTRAPARRDDGDGFATALVGALLIGALASGGSSRCRDPYRRRGRWGSFGGGWGARRGFGRGSRRSGVGLSLFSTFGR